MACAMTVGRTTLAALLLCCHPVFGDGVCEKGYRETTATERQTMRTALEAVRTALPEAPQGWVIGGYEEIDVPQSLCMDFWESRPWIYRFARQFDRVDDIEQRDEAMRQAGDALRQRQAGRQPQLDALTAKMESLGQQLGAAAERGDQAQVEALGREMEAVSAEVEALYNQGDDQAIIQAVATATGRDRSMSALVEVNPTSIAAVDAQVIAIPPGARSAYRWETASDGVTSAHVLVLLGAFQPGANGAMQTASGPPGQSLAAARAIAVTLEADPDRMGALLAAIDFPALAAMLLK